MIFHFIIARRHGAPAGYPLAAAFDDAGLLGLYNQYGELTGAQSKSFAAEHSELLFATVDNETLMVRHTHHYPDPDAVERRRKQTVLAGALELRAQNDRARQDVANAENLAAETASKIESLDTEQKELLAEHDEEQKRIADSHAQKEADDKAEQELSAEERAESDRKQKEEAAASTETATAALREAVTEPASTPGPVLPLP